MSDYVVISDAILKPFMDNECSPFSMSEMDLDQCESSATEEPHPFISSFGLYWVLIHILGFALSAFLMLLLGGLQVELMGFGIFGEPYDAYDTDDDTNEKKKM